jgi:hypothetical protein
MREETYLEKVERHKKYSFIFGSYLHHHHHHKNQLSTKYKTSQTGDIFINNS